MLCHVVLQILADILEEPTASIIRPDYMVQHPRRQSSFQTAILPWGTVRNLGLYKLLICLSLVHEGGKTCHYFCLMKTAPGEKTWLHLPE
jgi:hypothetical protein